MDTTKHPRSALAHQAPHATHRIAGERSVRAIRRGFYDNHVKEPGDVFSLRDGDELGSWMELESASDAAPVVHSTASSTPPAPQTDAVTEEHIAHERAIANERESLDDARAVTRARDVQVRDAELAGCAPGTLPLGSPATSSDAIRRHETAKPSTPVVAKRTGKSENDVL